MRVKINWDALGISASLLCAIHCALLPLFLGSVTLFGIEVLNNEIFEYFMIVLAFVVGCWSLFHGWKKHHNSRLPLLLFCMGFACLVLKQIWHQWHYWFLVPAVLLIVTGHWLNFSKSKRSHSKNRQLS